MNQLLHNLLNVNKTLLATNKEFGVDRARDTHVPKAGSLRSFELGIKRLHISDKIQSYQVHLHCVVQASPFFE